MNTTDSTFALPFAIGQTFWAPRTSSEKVVLPCPACKGERVVTVIYGGDEHVVIECEACGKGFNGPQGFIEEWQFTPAASKFVVAGLESMHQDNWRLLSTDGATMDLKDLCATEAEALAVSVQKCADQREHDMRSRQHARTKARDGSWSIAYHRNHIADCQRQIDWHTAKINAQKSTVSRPSSGEIKP